MAKKKKAGDGRSAEIRASREQRTPEARASEFLYLFSRESPHVRERILRDLPAYNSLLSLRASSFEDLALQQIAQQKGRSLGGKNALPDCPHCGSEKVGKKTDVNSQKENIYRCYDCRRTFSANYNSISSGTKCSALTWMKLLQCLLNFATIAKTCAYCEISETTYYNLRSRIFYAMQLFLDRVKLFGNIEVDNCFVRVSYKGVNLQENDFPEESIFFDRSFKPRGAKQRGGPTVDHNANKICIFTAIDDRGHVLTRYAGVGVANYRSLQSYIPDSKFILCVPTEDPFQNFLKPQRREPVSHPGDQSLLIADKESAIQKYAENCLHMDIEAHVYRRNGVQMQNTAYNIQRVNALHRRLKDFLRDCNYVSSKYLPGYLILFEFIENTGASPEAISEVFRILAKPNLGKAPSFYQEMYSVPNYLVEWLQSDHPLKKLPYNKLLAFYLYDHIKHKENYPMVLITMDDIERETSYSAPTIRNLYKALCDAGYRDMILSYFGEPSAKKTARQSRTKESRVTNAPTTFNPTVLAIYDEYAQNRSLPYEQRLTFSQFLELKNKEYGTNYKRTNLIDKFNKIAAAGLRPPLPEQAPKLPGSHRGVTSTALAALDAYDKIVLSYREQGMPVPPNSVILDELERQFHVNSDTIMQYISRARTYRKKQHLD